MLQGKKIVIGVTGSIAAYKIPFLIRLLIREGAEIKVIMTPAATDFVTPLTLSTLSRNSVIIEPFTKNSGEWNNHVELGLWADLMVFAPVTANTLSKMANGLADNFLVTAYLSSRCPVFIVPAMDMDMYDHPSTKRNLEVVKSFGNILIEPQVGELASGLSGPGRMEEPENILKNIIQFFNAKEDFRGKKVLVTAGPTFEKIDAVRYIGNFSSGKMGFALAKAAASRGADVTLVTGPTTLEIRHSRIKRIDINSAEEMLSECLAFFPKSDITIMSAAVADYTISHPFESKIKKKQNSLSLDLVLTTDILKRLGVMKRKNQLLVGFSLESDNEIANASLKLKSKNLDMIVMNSLNDEGAGFGHNTNKVTIISKKNKLIHGQLKDKTEIADDILDAIKSDFINGKVEHR
jgi:phosphopantothenoylcysteine decarboxylase / phosphopantothenate---cysteine ligase